jgi:hypothetical protein
MPEPDSRFFDADGNLDVMALWLDTQRLVGEWFGPVCWAEEEAEKLTAEHPDAADLIYHAITLTRPTWDEPLTEFLVRAHAWELTTRAAKGEDLRPGTDAEICVACSRMSMVAPLTDDATGLYGRCFGRIHPDDNPFAAAQQHMEALHGSQIDDLERQVRADIGRRVAAAGIDRRLFDGRGRPLAICKGLHHGEPVVCRFATTATTTPKTRVVVPAAGPAPQPAPPAGELDQAAQTSLFEIMMAVTEEARADAAD